MEVESAFVSVIVAALVGLGASIMIEQLMKPSPPLRRPWSAWAMHGGILLLAQGGVILLLGRPWFATAVVGAFLLMLVLVNNAKVKVLREPFLFQDYEYFTDLIRYPRLYIPFMGWWKFLGASMGFVLAVSIGLLGESIPDQRFTLFSQLGAIVVILGTGFILVFVGNTDSSPLSFCPESDQQRLGFLTSLWRYGKEEKHSPAGVSPFKVLNSANVKVALADLPHLIAVQSESFFDPRPIYQGIRTDNLAEFDHLKRDAVACGKLFVPAWGANTVRTEFEFLTGIEKEKLGVHAFNPYRAIVAGWDVQSIASFLRSVGYRTLCIHPYPSGFYRRCRVFPRLGFEEFIDIRSFDPAERSGPYISDVAVAKKVGDILGGATAPTFVYVITMENHGPLHLENVTALDNAELYTVPPPKGCEDLTIYLRHLRNADKMISDLRKTLETCGRDASLCWFGDHVPIMPNVYERFGEPKGDVDYCIWSNRESNRVGVRDLPAQNLSRDWLRLTGILS